MSDLKILATRRFGRVSEAEERLLRAVPKGEIAYCGGLNWDDPTNDPAKADHWGPERVIRAELIRWLCADQEASRQVNPRGVRVLAAKITDKLDLSYTTVTFPLNLFRCRLTSDIKLSYAKIPEVILDGSHTRCLLAEGAEVKGLFLLKNGFSADGEVRLIAAQIGGTLNCEGSSFSNSGGCYDPLEENNKGKAIRADRIKVEGGIFLRRGFKADGEVMLNGARVGGDFSCAGGTFRNLQDHALSAENASVGGNVFLFEGFRSYGTVDLFGARIGGNLNCLGGTFDRVILNTIVVKDTFVWSQIQNAKVVQLDLRNAAVGALADDERSWPRKGNLHLDGFVYGRFTGTPLEDSFGEVSDEQLKELTKRSLEPPVIDTPTDARTRLVWLESDVEVKLQPYQQLAKVLREMGDEDGAKQVLFEMEIRAGAFSRRRLILPLRLMSSGMDAISRETVGYGYYPLHAFRPLCALWFVGWILFRRAGMMAPSNSEAYKALRAGRKLPEHYPPFSAPVYSLENCVPLLNLGQDDRWQPDPSPQVLPDLSVPAKGWLARLKNHALRLATSYRVLRRTRWIMIVLGWLLATLVVAGLTGILKTK